MPFTLNVRTAAADMKEKPLSERSEEESSPVPQLEVPETLPVPRKIKVAWVEEQRWRSTTDEMSKNEDEKGGESRYSHTPNSSSQSNSSHLY